MGFGGTRLLESCSSARMSCSSGSSTDSWTPESPDGVSRSSCPPWGWSSRGRLGREIAEVLGSFTPPCRALGGDDVSLEWFGRTELPSHNKVMERGARCSCVVWMNPMTWGGSSRCALGGRVTFWGGGTLLPDPDSSCWALPFGGHPLFGSRLPWWRGGHTRGGSVGSGSGRAGPIPGQPRLDARYRFPPGGERHGGTGSVSGGTGDHGNGGVRWGGGARGADWRRRGRRAGPARWSHDVTAAAGPAPVLVPAPAMPSRPRPWPRRSPR